MSDFAIWRSLYAHADRRAQKKTYRPRWPWNKSVICRPHSSSSSAFVDRRMAALFWRSAEASGSRASRWAGRRARPSGARRPPTTWMNNDWSFCSKLCRILTSGMELITDFQIVPTDYFIDATRLHKTRTIVRIYAPTHIIYIICECTIYIYIVCASIERYNIYLSPFACIRLIYSASFYYAYGIYREAVHQWNIHTRIDGWTDELMH